jgi:hypothetical protein
MNTIHHLYRHVFDISPSQTVLKVFDEYQTVLSPLSQKIWLHIAVHLLTDFCRNLLEV